MRVACVCAPTAKYIYLHLLPTRCLPCFSYRNILYRYAGTSPHEDPATISVDSFDDDNNNNNMIQLLYTNRNGEIQRHYVFANKV